MSSKVGRPGVGLTLVVPGGAGGRRYPHLLLHFWLQSAVAPQVTARVPSAAVDYSDGTMLEAKHLLLAAAAFIEDARAYMKGQLVCGPVGEGLLWER